MYINNYNFTTTALEYLERGFSVIPVGKDKKPLIKWAKFQHRKPTKDEIERWATDYDNPNIAIITGEISGIVVVDVEEGGSTNDLTTTVISKTGGGGYHYYYKHPGHNVHNGVRLRDRLDLRADGGYVVAPPSLHQSGNHYEWLNGPDDTGFIDLPEWVLELKDEASSHKPVDWQKFIAKANLKGSRNQQAARLAGKLLSELKTDLWEVTGWSTLKEWNNTQNKPPIPEKELKTVWDSIKHREASKRGQTNDSAELEPITFAALETTINKWLLIKDTGLVKIIAATIIANRVSADPVWLFIVTASGGTKTEILRGLNKIKEVYPVSDLTPQTFLSGERGQNSSLLLRLPQYVILSMKDFTTVLTMHFDKRHAILSQLREIYDGQFKKEFGTGESKEWIGKMGFIAGVTSVIDKHIAVYQTLGERFIQYRPTQPDPIKMSMRAINNSGNEDLMREEIQDAFAAFIEGVDVPEGPIAIPEDMKNRIAHLAAFCVRARSGVIREGYSSREIELIPEVEMPTRLSKQLITLMNALALVDGGYSEENYRLLYKVGMDTIPLMRKQAIMCLLRHGDIMLTEKVAIKLHYPTNTIRRVLEDMAGLKLIKRYRKHEGNADGWSVRDNILELLEIAQSANPPDLQPISDIFFDGKVIPEVSDGSGQAGLIIKEG